LLYTETSSRAQNSLLRSAIPLISSAGCLKVCVRKRPRRGEHWCSIDKFATELAEELAGVI